MVLLSTITAFALVMIMLSTAVSSLVEIILRISRMRAAILRQAINSLVVEVVWPNVKGDPDEQDVGTATAIASIINELVRNPAVPQDPLPSATRLGKAIDFARPAIAAVKSWVGFGNSPNIDHLSTSAFVQRLAKTDVGKALAARGDEALSLMVKDFANSFERYTAASTEIFRKRAHYISVFAAILIAVFANIDASRLFETLYRDTNVRTTLINEADSIIRTHIPALRVDDNPDPDQANQQESLDDTKKKIRELQSQLASIRTTYKLPIGWGHFPYCRQSKNVDLSDFCVELAKEEKLKEAAGEPPTKLFGMPEFYSWLLNAIFAGLLIGLGGPFWLKVFTGLSQLTGILGAIGGKNKEVVSEAKSLKDKKDSEEPDDEFVKLFKVSGHIDSSLMVAKTTDKPEPAG